MTKARTGNQKPRIDIYKNGDIWLADKTIELLDYYGIKLIPWQRAILRRWLALDEHGKWANSECGLSISRQNGKTELLIARIIGGMVFRGEALVYTAQSVQTTDEIKRRVLRFFYDAESELRDMMTADFDSEPKSLNYIELRNGGRCIFSTRTRTSGLGHTSDTLLLDEATELTDAQQEALIPTLAAGHSQNHQTIMASMPPTTGSTGTVFVRTRNNVLTGKAPDYCWQEWSVETITDMSDEEAWYDTNPSLGYFLMKSAIKNEASTMSIDSFNRMRLGWYQGMESSRAISDDDWQPLAVKEVVLPAEPSLAYAVKFAPDRSAVSLAVGVNMPDDMIHIELVERRPMSDGTGWLVQWLLERWRNANKVIIDGAAGSQLLVEELVRSDRRISKRLLTPSVKDATAAYGAFYDAIEQSKLTHYDQPALNVSVRTVKKRSIGTYGAFGFAPLNPDIQADPVEAVAFAYYGAVKYQGNKPSGSSNQQVML